MRRMADNRSYASVCDLLCSQNSIIERNNLLSQICLISCDVIGQPSPMKLFESVKVELISFFQEVAFDGSVLGQFLSKFDRVKSNVFIGLAALILCTGKF